MKKIGVALGSGGARGLSQITMLEVFEELGIKPHIISGSSIGAVIGTAYASGMTTTEIKNSISEILLRQKSKSMDLFRGFDVAKLWNLVDLSVRSSGIIKGEKFVDFFSSKIKVDKFDELTIKMRVVATEYYRKQQKIFDTGDIISAVKASYSLPMLFAPVKIKNSLYLDGGMVNPLPYDIISNECDIVVGIDASPKIINNSKNAPSGIDTLFSSFQIMQASILNEKLKISAPDILIRTDITDVRLFEFNKAEMIWEQAKNQKEELKTMLDSIINKN